MKKQVLAVSAVLGIAAIALSAGTLAYFTDQTETVKNTFTVGNVDITLDEAEVDPETNKVKEGSTTRVLANTYENVAPGTTLDKDPTITNVGKNDAWVRIKLQFTGNSYFQQDLNDVMSVLSGMAGDDEEFVWKTSVKPENFNRVFVGYDNSKWDAKETKDKTFFATPENFIYEWTFTYKEKLAKDETAKLFDAVKLSSKVEHISDFDINLIAEAVQADGFDTAEAAFAATFDAE